MSFSALAFLISLLVNLAIIRATPEDGRLRTDPHPTKPQRFHSHAVPRIGGVGIFVAVCGGAGTAAWSRYETAQPLLLLVACALPAFFCGLIEDVTHNVSPRRRLFFTTVSAALAAGLLDAVLVQTDIPGIDLLIRWFPFALALTLFTVTGVSNSINIIDGFNGLASMCVLIIASTIAYVAFQVGDATTLFGSLIVAGAVLGFFVWNFPAGLIFLGDGGAYLLGFLVAELGVLLIRNREVSPLFPLLLCGYPIFETVFTMYRRRVVRGVQTAAPDGIHLHTLIHRRLVRGGGSRNSHERRQIMRNSMTSPYLWLVCLTSAVPSLLWWDNSAVLGAFIVLFMVLYVLLYRSIVRFRTPKWLLLRR